LASIDRQPAFADLRKARSVLTYWPRAGRRPIFSTVEKSVGIACPCAHTVGEGVGALCGDRRPGFADLGNARSVLTNRRGRGDDGFSRPSGNRVATACPCAHTVGGGVGARCDDALPRPAARFGRPPTGNLHIWKSEFQATPQCSIRKKPQACSRSGSVWARFCGSRLWRPNE